MEDIQVSIICLTYNHEKYIKRTLESFISQKTDFKYEVLIHDDASTDGTAEIIREYEKKYPNIIKPIYQKENQYSQKKPIVKKYILPLIKGKYIAFCEGDDYWTRDDKLQRQFEILENDSTCIMVCHNTMRVTVDDKEIGCMIKKASNGYLLPENLIYKTDKNPHFSSLMYRVKLLKEERPAFFKLTTGDNSIRYWALTKGKIYYIDEVMSAYRVNIPNSWTDRMSKNRDKRIIHTQNVINFLKQYDEYTDYTYHESVKKEMDKRQLSLFKLKGEYKSAYLLSKQIGSKKKERIKLWALANFPILKKLK